MRLSCQLTGACCLRSYGAPQPRISVAQGSLEDRFERAMRPNVRATAMADPERDGAMLCFYIPPRQDSEFTHANTLPPTFPRFA